MAFSRINDVLEQKTRTHGALRSFRDVAILKKAWESGGVSSLSLSKKAKRHLVRSCRVASFTKRVVVLTVEDASAAAMLSAQKQSLLVFFKKRCPEMDIGDISIQRVR